MGFLEKFESAFLRARWIDVIPEAIAAVISGPVGCGGTTPLNRTDTTPPPEQQAVFVIGDRRCYRQFDVEHHSANPDTCQAPYLSCRCDDDTYEVCPPEMTRYFPRRGNVIPEVRIARLPALAQAPNLADVPDLASPQQLAEPPRVTNAPAMAAASQLAPAPDITLAPHIASVREAAVPSLPEVVISMPHPGTLAVQIGKTPSTPASTLSFGPELLSPREDASQHFKVVIAEQSQEAEAKLLAIVETLGKALQHQDAAFRSTAVAALHNITTSPISKKVAQSIVSVLISGLQSDPDEKQPLYISVYEEIANALADIGPEARDAIPVLEQAYIPRRIIRYQAVQEALYSIKCQ